MLQNFIFCPLYTNPTHNQKKKFLHFYIFKNDCTRPTFSGITIFEGTFGPHNIGVYLPGPQTHISEKFNNGWLSIIVIHSQIFPIIFTKDLPKRCLSLVAKCSLLPEVFSKFAVLEKSRKLARQRPWILKVFAGVTVCSNESDHLFKQFSQSVSIVMT